VPISLFKNCKAIPEYQSQPIEKNEKAARGFGINSTNRKKGNNQPIDNLEK